MKERKYITFNLNFQHIANRQLEKSQWTQINRKNTDYSLFKKKIAPFEFQRKKIDGLKALLELKFLEQFMLTLIL